MIRVAFLRRVLPGVLLLLVVVSWRIAAQRVVRNSQRLTDWPQFGLDVASSGATSAETGITATNAASLARRQIPLNGTVDASAIYLHGVTVNGSIHDVFFLTTIYGKTIALDADSGDTLWEYTPPNFTSWAGTAQITNSTPAADPDRQYLYAAAPDGTVQKLAIADGHSVWTTPITLLPNREKIASPLKVFGGHVIAVTGGYIGDQPPYQGHVAVLDAQSGGLLQVWNSLCSDRPGLIQPASCQSTRSAIWGRAGAVIDLGTGNIFVATGNGPYNGLTDWGDSVIELDPGATEVLGNYTPADNASLDAADVDLGSTSPALAGAGILAQGGKDSLIRLLGISAIAGTAPHTGGELTTVSTPSQSMLFTAQAVWRNGTDTWLFAADNGATTAWTVSNGTLKPMWSQSTGGTSPVVAGGLLYVYDPNGGLHIYEPKSGTRIAILDCGGGHWNSPIVVDGRVALPEGNANQHATTGLLDIWTAPGPRRSPGKTRPAR
ncbi:MAG TPA: PQQ-binding-like beta-propeller repeat protein [Bryobacteraceae bacterium]|nr:PQQ-binding-like beta-propeller repeat protein [Bryobacteraceae bacterium]